MPVFIGVSAREVLAGDLPLTSYRPPVTPPLQDSTGSRRYICIRIPDGQLIDNTGEIDYGQLYAQVVYELQVLKAPYWFNNEEVARIQQLNQEYMEQKDIAEIIMACFRKPKEDEIVKTMNSTEMLKIIQREYPSVQSTHGTKVSIGTGVQTGGLWEVYGRSPAKTSRAEPPINTGFFKENGRSDGFFSLHLIYQDSVGSDFFVFGTQGVYPI